MPILFALIFVAHHKVAYMGSDTTTAVRIGAYEKLSQCKSSGKNLVDAMTGHEADAAYFFCVPVNQ